MLFKGAVGLVKAGQLRLMGSLLRLSGPLYRVHWLAAASSEGVLARLAQGPRTEEQLSAELGMQPAGREGFEAWLQFGVRLGELRRGPKGLELAGHLAKALARPEADPMAALLQESADLHVRLLSGTLRKAREGKRFTLADQSGDLIARSSRALEPLVFAAVDAFVPRKGAVRLLEIGCGSGTYIRRACRQNGELTALGLELQAEAAAQARRNLDGWGLAERAAVEEGDVRNRKPEPAFDLATLHNNIYYFAVAERVALLEHVRGFLKPGGALLLTTGCQGGSPGMEALNLWAAATEGCGRLPTPEELVGQMKEAGFESARAKRLVPGESYFAFFAR